LFFFFIDSNHSSTDHALNRYVTVYIDLFLMPSHPFPDQAAQAGK